MRSLIPVLLLPVALACATSVGHQEPVQATVVNLDANERLKVDQVVMVLDASGSMDPQDLWPAAKAFSESFVAGMPDGSYDTKLIVFGGSSREGDSYSSFNRAELAGAANDATFLGEYTPIDDVLVEVGDTLEGKGGIAALILVTDGEPTLRGTPRDPNRVIQAAANTVQRHGGVTCIHTVQVGDSERGAELLETLSRLSTCGTYRTLSSLDSGSALYAYQRDIFVGAMPAVAAKAVGDMDGDGVLDDVDACPGTPLGATVDERGCWVLRTPQFAFDSTKLEGAGLNDAALVADVLRDNPDMRIEIAGFTDSVGPEAYNLGLSERRAQSIKDAIVQNGISPDRIAIRGLGESNPVAPNDTTEGRALNRRVEFSVIE